MSAVHKGSIDAKLSPTSPTEQMSDFVEHLADLLAAEYVHFVKEGQYRENDKQEDGGARRDVCARSQQKPRIP